MNDQRFIKVAIELLEASKKVLALHGHLKKCTNKEVLGVCKCGIREFENAINNMLNFRQD